MTGNGPLGADSAAADSAAGGSKNRRVVLVTGASGGVGEGIAIACGSAGWEVWIAARRTPEGSAVAQRVNDVGGHGHFVQCDVTNAESVEAAITKVRTVSGKLDGVVHNATSSLSSEPSSPLDLTPDELEDHLSVSVRGLFLLAKSAFPLLAESKGALVATTSEAGFEGKPNLAAYAAAKAAQRGVVRTLAREWGPAGVRANCVAPLAHSSAMESAFVRDPSMEARVLSRIPLGRLGDAALDIGPVVRFLLSDEARYVTSQTVMVDGGSCAIS